MSLHKNTLRTIVFSLAALFILSSCQTAPKRSEQAPVSVNLSGSADGMTREQLEGEVRRFALRFASALNQFFEDVRETELTPYDRRRIVLAQTKMNTSLVDIAIGENAVTSLLDMLVLTSIARATAEKEAADLYGDDTAMVLINLLHPLEADIWEISDRVLTEQQQSQLKSLIDDWLQANTGRLQIYYVRFGSFTGVDAAELADVQQSGGLLAEVSRVVDTAEELERLGQRMLFYFEFAPLLTTLQAQSTIYEIMRQPEIQDSLSGAQSFARTVEELPDARLAFVDQLLEGIAAERAALMNDIVSEQATIRQVLADLRPLIEATAQVSENVSVTMQSIERTADAVNLDMSPAEQGGEGQDIGVYRDLAIESAKTALELRQLVESLETLAGSEAVNRSVTPAFQTVRDEIDYFMHRLFVLLMITIVIFFGALFLYRHGVHRYHHKAG